jgi:6-hydroxycyclohex-1-ene-1-carbonyl-CoA dehydrogenase
MSTLHGWQMTAPGQLTAFERPITPPGAGKVLVEVHGCGVCHTDVSFLYGGVPTRHPLPLTLGHEVSGVVVQAGPGAEGWLSRRVIVPAVSPCGTCAFCTRGKPTACRASKMPGNDIQGGFASHLEVDAWSLCKVDAHQPSAPVGEVGLSLWELSVIADAVSTPLQAIARCGLEANDFAVVIGAGGVGSFAVQLAQARGAKVAALDVDAAALDRARGLGAIFTADARTPAKDLKKALAVVAKEHGARAEAWRLFETSGSKGGQELAWSLLNPGATLSVVGFTPEPVSVRLSNLMAFDASAYGNWGCDPALYPEALALVSRGAVRIRGLVKSEKLSDAPQVLEAVHHHQYSERVVLVP